MAATSISNKQSKQTIVHWFRKGLRIHDNPALRQACELVNANPEQYVLRPIFILDPDIRTWMRVGANRLRFLQESLAQLDTNLKSINSRLYVVRGNPVDVFPRLWDEWNVSCLTFECDDIEPYARKRDEEVESQAKGRGVKVIKEVSHTVYDPERVLALNNGRPITNYRSFQAVISKIKAAKPVDPPSSVNCTQPEHDSVEKKDSNCYNVPELEELIADISELQPSKFPGGETEALARLERHLKNTKWICSFEKPNTSPNSLEPSTTVLSPYLKFGCLSSRLFHQRLTDIYSKNSKHSQPPVSLMGQLLWREFYYSAAAGEPNFDRMEGNRICYQIPWESNKEHLEAWTHGRTGYPFIDAIMRQLRQEGWIHHLARHAVACFLTRGDLWISWEEGQKVFEELLLDADWALNAGNWMWLSASAFFYQYFRVYSPIAFGKKTDKEGKFIRKYVPELKKYPSPLIYEPWKASNAEQKHYGCVVGKDYPKRIVVHEEISKENLGKMAKAYKKNKELLQLGKEEVGYGVSTKGAAKKRKYDD